MEHSPINSIRCLAMLDLDEVLLAIGPFGRYQKLIIWLILFPAVFPCGFHAYNQLFMAKMPEHWCRLPSVEGIQGTRVKELRYDL